MRKFQPKPVLKMPVRWPQTSKQRKQVRPQRMYEGLYLMVQAKHPKWGEPVTDDNRTIIECHTSEVQRIRKALSKEKDMHDWAGKSFYRLCFKATPKHGALVHLSIWLEIYREGYLVGSAIRNTPTS